MKEYYSLKDFSLGLNDKASPNLLDDRELAEAINVVLGVGYTSKRNGYEQIGSVSAAIRKLYEWKKTNGTTEFLCMADMVYKQSGASFVSVTGALSSGGISAITTKDRSTNDVVLIADGAVLKRYDGTNTAAVTAYAPATQEQTNPGLNDLANLTTFRAMTMHKGRLYTAAHPVHKNRVSFCHIDPTLGYAVHDYFPAVNFFDVATGTGDEVVQLHTFRDALVILCKKSVWALYGDTTADFQLIKINVPAGCVSPKSVVEVGNNLFYLSDTHVYALYATDFNTVSAQVVSDKVEGTLKGISLSEKQAACGVYYDNKYYLSFPSGATLVYDTLLQAWTKFTNVQASSFLVKDGALYFGTDTNKIHQFKDIYHDNGQAIPFTMKTKRLDFGMMVNKKKLRRMWIQSKQYETATSGYTIDAVFGQETKRLVTNKTADQTLPKWDTAVWDTDLWDIIPHKNPNSAKWDEAVWDSSRWDFLEIQQEEIKIGEKSRTLQLTITNNALYQPITIYGVEFEYKPTKP